MNKAEKKELLNKVGKEKLLKELNDLNKGLINYRKRQEKHVKMKFTEGQKRKLDELRLRLQRKYRWNKEAISKYSGPTSIKIVGMDWNAFVYSLRSLYMEPNQFTALDRAISAVATTIRKIESMPVASIDWRELSVTPHPKNQAKETDYLFNSMQLHPIVVKASKSLFETNHYSQAIFEAFKAVNNLVKEKSGLSPNELRGMKESKLMAKVFDVNNPIIKLNELVTDTDKNEQEGFKFLFMGATIGIRNPKAHDNVIQTDPYRTLEYLGFASLLMRRIEEGKVVKL